MEATRGRTEASRAIKRPGFSLGAVLLFVALACTPAAGEQAAADLSGLPIEELARVEIDTVYGASKYLQDIAEAPASVTIITRDDIRNYGYRSLAELLQSVRGFSVTYDRNYYYAGIRGFNRPGDYGTRLLLLIDGIRINDAIYDQTPIGFNFPLDIDLIDHVEVIRGPSQSLYGSNAVFGVINVVTRKASDLGGFEVSAHAGSFATYGGRLTYGNRFGNGARLLLSGTFAGSGGQDLYFREFDQPGTSDGWARKADGSRVGSGFFHLARGDFSVEGLLANARKNIPTAPWETVFNSAATRTTDTSQLLSLKYEHSFPAGLDVMARITASWYRYRGDYLYDRAESPPPAYDLGKDSAYGYWLGYDLTLVKELSRHKIMIGSELRHNYRQDQAYQDANGLWSDRRTSFSWGVFAQDEYRLLDTLILNAGLRYDHFSTFGSTTNPRIALIWSPLDDTTVKAIYSQAFRAPNTYELYYYPPDPQQSRLREERTTSFEAVLEQKFGEHLSATVDAFLIHMKNIISQDQTSTENSNLPFTNSGEFETRGVELALQGSWADNLRGVASYSLQSTHDEKTGESLVNAPRQLGKLNLTLPLPGNRLLVGVEEQYTAARKTLAGTEVSEYWLTNLTLFAPRLLPNLQLSASVYNLFDKKFDDPGAGEHLISGLSAIRQDGRAFRINVTCSF
jgi:iron complex outermembrane receptor protein